MHKNKIIYYYLSITLLIVLFFIYDFNKTKVYESDVILDNVNSKINNTFKKISLTFDFIKIINQNCEADTCTLSNIGTILSKDRYFFDEFFFQEKGGKSVFYVNKMDSGKYELDIDSNSIIKAMRTLGDYRYSKPYMSKTTGKYSFLISTEYQSYIFFIEISIENLFDSDDLFIIDEYHDEFIYDSDINEVTKKTDAFSVSNFNPDRYWQIYFYKYSLKLVAYSTENVFGWNLVYTINIFNLINSLIGIVSLITVIYIYITSGFKHYVNDELSGLKARGAFLNDKIDNRVKAFCFLDIDHFKKINDNYSHATGDEAIKAFSHCLKENIRDTDVAFRWGGEEFLLILRGDCNECVDVYSILDRLRDKVENIKVKGLPAFTVSIGYCEYDAKEEVKTLIKKADLAMYASKRAGRNLVTKYSDSTG